MKGTDQNEKHFYAAENLPGYKPVYVLIRVVSVVLFAIVSLSVVIFLTNNYQFPPQVPIKYFIQVSIIYVLLTELQIFIDYLLERIYPVPFKLSIRMTIQVLSGIILIVIAVWVATSNLHREMTDTRALTGMYLSITFAVFTVYTIANSLIMYRLTRKWLNSQRHIDQLKQEKLLMDYNSLQDQLNPHFLFNNLSVLKSLIIYDTDTAVKFTENFTDVYRYVLQSKDKLVVNLGTELEFIEAYIGLHKERLGEGLTVQFSIAKDCIHKDIAPLTLQLLVENAIKHNVCSIETPLHVDINAEDDVLVVSNNIQLKDSSYSTHTGLTNLRERYQFLTKEKMIISDQQNIFTVQVPLIS